MDSERPPSSRVEALSGSTIANARGALRESLGAVRNLAQLLQSLRVAPKSLAAVLPDVLEACSPMRDSMHTLLVAMGERAGISPARVALESFFEPRLTALEQALTQAMLRPLNAKSRLALEQVVTASSRELDAARALLQLLEDAVCERPVTLEPRELVREAFSARNTPLPSGAPRISAVLTAERGGYELELNPRVGMVLIALGVELVASRPGREMPNVIISTDGLSTCTVRIRRANASGEPLVLSGRGLVEPTLPCIRAAAALTRAELAWDPAAAEFSLSYPLGTAARAV